MWCVATHGSQCFAVLLLCRNGHWCLFDQSRFGLLVIGHDGSVLPAQIFELLVLVALERRWGDILLIFKVHSRRN